MTKEQIEKKLDRMDNFVAVCIALVAIGVAGELILHLKEKRLNKQLSAIQNAEIAGLQDSAAQANKLAAEIQWKLKEADRQRLFSGATSVIEVLKRYPNQKYWVNYRSTNNEAHAFASQIDFVFHMMFKWNGGSSGFDLPGDYPPGISVNVSAFADPNSPVFKETLKRAEELAEALAKDNMELCPDQLVSKLAPNVGANGLTDPELIMINIGPKVPHEAPAQPPPAN
jgi:hypothetical protein